MRPLIWSRKAQRSLAKIYKYLVQFNPDAARRVVFEIYDAADILGRHPYVGRGMSGGRRELVVAPYVIVYRVRTGQIHILNVWHGAQNRPG
jgi:addiction module RelE/StbE family toxin